MRARLVLGLVLSTPGLSHAQSAAVTLAQDHFDDRKLSPAWETSRFTPGAMEMQSRVVRQGAGAVKVTVRPNDMFEAGRNGNADSERDELMEAHALASKQGELYETAWSMYVPEDFPIVPVRLVVAQWKQFCGGEGKPCDDDSPVLALRYIGGVLSVTQDLQHQTHVLYEQMRDLRGKWLDLRLQTRFTPDTTGRVRVWLDGSEVVNYTGITANPQNSNTGYSAPGHFYFKMGLYRNRMSQPMTIYLDEYSKRLLTPTFTP